MREHMIELEYEYNGVTEVHVVTYVDKEALDAQAMQA